MPSSDLLAYHVLVSISEKHKPRRYSHMKLIAKVATKA